MAKTSIGVTWATQCCCCSVLSSQTSRVWEQEGSLSVREHLRAAGRWAWEVHLDGLEKNDVHARGCYSREEGIPWVRSKDTLGAAAAAHGASYWVHYSRLVAVPAPNLACHVNSTSSSSANSLP